MQAGWEDLRLQRLPSLPPPSRKPALASGPPFLVAALSVEVAAPTKEKGCPARSSRGSCGRRMDARRPRARPPADVALRVSG